MVRHHHRVGAGVNRAPRVVADVHALDDDLALPGVADPFEVGPCDDRRFERACRHRRRASALPGQDDVGKLHQAAVAEEAGQPARLYRELHDERQHLPGIPGDELLHAVAKIALTHAGDRRIDGDDNRGVAGLARASDCRAGDVVAADEIQLIPGRPGGRVLDVFEQAARQRRQRVDRAKRSGHAGGHFLAARVEHPRASDRRQDDRHGDLGAEHGRAHVVLRGGDGAARAENDLVVGARVLRQRVLAIRAAVDVIEDGPWKAAFGAAPQILDVEGS